MTQIISGNYWFWISAAELLLIFFLIRKLYRSKKVRVDSATEDLLNNSKKSNVDMSNIMDSINKARELYKQLSSKYHPDLFLDEADNKKAVEIFQEITKNKRNYGKLLSIKEDAEQQFGNH